MNNERTINPNAPADFTPQLGDYKTLQPFRYWCQKVLPLVYDDSLSYYELLCKVVDYLNKTMEDAETLHSDVDNLYDAYVKLQGYVNDYFKNLDVQQEINNKLDELVKDGTLEKILSHIFKKKANFYDSVESMKKDTMLSPYDFCVVLAYEKTNGQNAYYYVTDVKPETDYYVTLNNNLYAVLCSNYVTLEQFGAVGDGETDDKEALSLAVNSGKPILLLNKTYLVSEGVSSTQLNIKGNGFKSTIKYTGNDYLFTLPDNSIRFGSSFTDLKIDCSSSGSGINIDDKHCWGTKIINCIILNSKVGIRSICIETLIDGCSLYNYDIIYNSVGIMLNCTDSRIDNTDIANFQTGVLSTGGSNLINAHIWSSLLLQECTGLDLSNSSGGVFSSDWLVLDSVKTGIKLNQYSRCTFDKVHCVMNTYVPYTEMKVFDNITPTFYGTLFIRTLSFFGAKNITFNVEPNDTYSLLNLDSWYGRITIFNTFNAYQATVAHAIPSPIDLLISMRGFSGNGYSISSGTDLNTFNKMGVYFFNGNNVTHSPTTEETNYLINLFGNAIGPQIVISNNNKMYFRTYPTRQDWQEITSTNNPSAN